MIPADFETFKALITDVCVAYDRPVTDDRVRVFWDDLKGVHLADVIASIRTWRKTKSKMPAPRDLIPERSTRPSAPPREDAASAAMSTWAVAGNKILLAVAYMDVRRGFKPMAVYDTPPPEGWNKNGGFPMFRTPIDADLMNRVIAAKNDLVSMAETDAASGMAWSEQDFNRTCREAFETLLGTTKKGAEAPLPAAA